MVSHMNSPAALFRLRTLLLSALLLPLLNVPAQGEDYTKLSSIPYTQGASGPLVADAYLPRGKGSFPGVLFIHGGGWSSGDRGQMYKIMRALAEKGYVCFTIDYDYSPAVTFPKALDESLQALIYMRAHAQELHLDPTRIAVAGSSAGGELAGLVALTPHLRSTGQEVAPVQAALLLNAALDMTTLEDKGSMITNYLGAPCSKKMDACIDASPAKHIAKGAPAFYVGHGTADQSVPFAQAASFVHALQNASVPVQFYIADGGPHTYWNQDRFSDENIEQVEKFLGAVLGKSK